MYGFGPNSNVRILGFRFFQQLGLHCATHQIRVILISAVFITSLFYPALAIYSSSQPEFLARFSSRLLDSFLATEALASYSAHHDLRDMWTGYDSFRVREDSVARARCGTEGIFRVERVLIHSALPEDTGALNNQILLSTLKFEQQIGEILASKRIPCLSKPDATCFVQSPIAFWDYDESRLLSDPNILDTLQLSTNVTISGVPITPHMVLAGRETTDSTLDFAMFLVLTYIFPETDCSGNAGHFAWLRTLQQAADRRGDLIAKTKEPNLVALEYKGTTRSYYSALSTFSYLAYFSLFIYGHQLSRRTDGVHSKIGVAFTGMVEIVASTITSLSVCALAGFKITMVPWEIFPILVIFVGMENMFSLVDAVYKTSIALPVKERIAEGLSRAGTSNTLKLVAYNAILGVIAFFSVGAIRQFCAFAVVVLVAHWFLAHVFFIAVLSIDLQRLELDELLQQGTSLAPAISKEPPQIQADTRWQKAALSASRLLQGRANKNITLLLLLAITGVLYYSTQPSFIRTGEPTRSHLRGALSRGNPITMNTEIRSPASHIWHLLNPNDDPLVHLRIEPPSIMIFRPDITDAQPLADPKLYHRSRLSVRAFKRLVWMLKIVMGPILATIGILYALLLYLLKDAQLLEAQHNRAERDTPDSSSMESPLNGHISFTTLPRVFSTDVEMLAASRDGRVVATIGMRNEFVIWRTSGDNPMHASIDVTDVLLRSASTSAAALELTALTVDDGGHFCAVGTGAGVIAVWNIDGHQVKPLPKFLLSDSPFAIRNLCFIISSLTPNSPTRTADSLLATYANGTAINWTMDGSGESTLVHSSRGSPSTQCTVLAIPSRGQHIVAFLAEDGSLEVCDVYTDVPTLEFCVLAGNPTDPVVLVHACDLEINGKIHTIIGAATKAGVISIWDGDTSECISTIDDVYGEVNNLRLSAVKTKTCTFCGELSPDTFTISFSVGQIVLMYRAYVFDGATRKCSCPSNQPQQVPFRSAGVLAKRRSRNGSVASSGTSSPLHSRSRHHSLSGGSASTSATHFPVSGHGVHSRRGGEKDTLRRAVESMVLPTPRFDTEELDKTVSSLGVPANSLSPPLAARSSLWDNTVVVRTADTTFERGKWDVVNNKIIGLRRRPRTPFNTKPSTIRKIQLKPDSSSGLSPATLERWELWMFDPLVSRVQVSSLAMLQHHQCDPASDARLQNDPHPNPIPRLPFTRVSPFVCGASYCFAGFGNTVGLFELTTPAVKKKTTDNFSLE